MKKIAYGLYALLAYAIGMVAYILVVTPIEERDLEASLPWRKRIVMRDVA